MITTQNGLVGKISKALDRNKSVVVKVTEEIKSDRLGSGQYQHTFTYFINGKPEEQAFPLIDDQEVVVGNYAGELAREVQRELGIRARIRTDKTTKTSEILLDTDNFRLPQDNYFEMWDAASLVDLPPFKLERYCSGSHVSGSLLQGIAEERKISGRKLFENYKSYLKTKRTS